MQLTPQDISDSYTLEEIEIELTSIKSALTIARQSVMDKFGDMQANQQTQRQTIKDLNSDLAIYVKAKNILSGTDSSTANLTSLDYNSSVSRI